jgi:hypothetical protein
MQIEGKEKANHVEKEVGNVNADSDISFEYGVRRGVDFGKQNINSLPFQVQVGFNCAAWQTPPSPSTHLGWGAVRSTTRGWTVASVCAC